MINQLLKQIWTNRAVNAWLWGELLVVFVCLSYLVDYLYATATVYFSPMGYDIEHVYKVTLGEISSASGVYRDDETESTRVEHLATALERMRAHPGVEFACVNDLAPPYNQRQSNGSHGIDTTWVHGWVFRVTPSFFSVFRVADKQGRIDPLVETAMQERTVIVSEDAERKFALKGVTALNEGLKYWQQKEPYATVRAIAGSFRFDEFQHQYPAYYQCMSEISTLKLRGTDTGFSIRVRPEADTPGFAANFREALKTQLRLGNIYLMDIISYEDIRTNYFRSTGDINDVKTHIAGLAFLLVNILLGVVGTFWIRTQQRRAEIAVRMAMGASRGGVRTHLIAEGVLLLLLAVVPATFICGNIVRAELIVNSELPFTAGRFVAGQLMTLALMLGMIVAGILFPARQAMRIKPAEALHEE